jgi:formylmethanofuran dehydrogenase subunit C
MSLQLRWRGATALPVDADGLTPESLASLSTVERARWPLRVGNSRVPLGDLFELDGALDDGRMVFEGDLRQVRRLGRGMASGTLTIDGDVGSEVGAEMSGGTIDVTGSAGDRAGAALRGGLLRIRGAAGHGLGAAYPGSRSGMRDGVILAGGGAGDDVGLAMRRGLIAIKGMSGDGLGRNLVAGSIFTFGPMGRAVGAGMKRGTLAFFGLPDPSDPPLLPTFAPSGRLRPHFVAIYLRQLSSWGFPVPGRAFSDDYDRYNGDLGVRGQGEVLIAVAS